VSTRQEENMADGDIIPHQAVPGVPANAGAAHHARPGKHLNMWKFRGVVSQDGREWLKEYSQFADCHGWDDIFRLANVKFFLEDGARLWWRNNEDTCDTWNGFVNLFREVYADGEKIKRTAEAKLRTRTQKKGETCFDYVQNVIQLSRDSKPDMSEEERVENVLKGIAANVFTYLALKEVKTVAEIVTTVKKLDQLWSKRVQKTCTFKQLEDVIDFPTYPRQSDNESSDSEDDDDSNASEDGFDVEPFSTPKKKSKHKKSKKSALDITATIRQVVEEIMDKRLPRQPTIAVTDTRPVYNARPVYNTRTTAPYQGPRRCWYCQKPGHIERFCWNRQRDQGQVQQQSQPVYNNYQQPSCLVHNARNDAPSYNMHYPPYVNNNSVRYNNTNSRNRSQSPAARGRSPGRRPPTHSSPHPSNRSQAEGVGNQGNRV
jgi:hypothetical protein